MVSRGHCVDDAYPVVELDDSDRDNVSSSDDEIDKILNAAAGKRTKRCARGGTEEDASSEDDFEKEMSNELSLQMKNIVAQHGMSNTCKQVVKHAATEEPACYDNVYFDSDSDEEGSREEKKKRKHPVLSNDELLYDPHMDDDDQAWVDRQRRRYQPLESGAHDARGARSKPRPLPNSDAVLNCPGCMSVLCLDCQRHEFYKHQYRAMFVVNCTVLANEVLRYPNKPQKRQKKKQRGTSCDGETQPDVDAATSESKPASEDDIYHPVKCSICNTEVGVCDKDEVYIFFNVLASHS